MNGIERFSRMDPQARAVLIGFNPKAGAGSSHGPIARLRESLAARGFEAECETDIDRIATRGAEWLAAGRLRAVVAAGGDGTISLFANRLPPDCPLAVFPLGTENLMAKHLEFSSDPQALAAAIAAGHTARIDAGTANGKLFLIVASCGLDADVVQQVHERRRGNISRLSYAWPLFRSIGRYRYPKMRIRLDNRRPITARWAFVFNVPRYALHLPIVHDANCLDGQLDLCAFRHGSLMNGLRYAGGIVLRLHRSWSDTVVTRFQSLTIESDDAVPVQLDGDPGGELPLSISVAPERLRVIVSEKWVQSQRAAMGNEAPPAPMA